MQEYIAQKYSQMQLRASNFQKFSGGHASRPPSSSMLRMLSVLCTLSIESDSILSPPTLTASSASEYYYISHI